MSTDNINIGDQLREAEDEARLALLKQIAKSAPNHSTGASLQALASAFALTVGGKWGYLPGGPTE